MDRECCDGKIKLKITKRDPGQETVVMLEHTTGVQVSGHVFIKHGQEEGGS